MEFFTIPCDCIYWVGIPSFHAAKTIAAFEAILFQFVSLLQSETLHQIRIPEIMITWHHQLHLRSCNIFVPSLKEFHKYDSKVRNGNAEDRMWNDSFGISLKFHGATEIISHITTKERHRICAPWCTNQATQTHPSFTVSYYVYRPPSLLAKLYLVKPVSSDAFVWHIPRRPFRCLS